MSKLLSLPREIIENISILLHPHDFETFWTSVANLSISDQINDTLLFLQNKCLQRFLCNNWTGLRRLDWTRLGAGFRASALAENGFDVETIRVIFPELFIWSSDLADQCEPFSAPITNTTTIFKLEHIRLHIQPKVNDALMGMIQLKKGTKELPFLLNPRGNHTALRWCALAKDEIGFQEVLKYAYKGKLPENL
jgi:hypothetical protein